MRELASLLAGLPVDALQALASGFASGNLTCASSSTRLESAVGLDRERARQLAQLLQSGPFASGEHSDRALSLALESLLATRSKPTSASDLIELVLSGPAAGREVMRDTASVFAAILQEAREEILLTGYAVAKARTLLEPLARYLDADDSRRATIVLDFRRDRDTSMPELIAARRANEFWRSQWPTSRRRPTLCYDPRALDPDPTHQAAMHAKVVVIDRRLLFVTSANLTPRAQSENIELGILLRHSPTATRVADYFDALRATGQLRESREI